MSLCTHMSPKARQEVTQNALGLLSCLSLFLESTWAFGSVVSLFVYSGLADFPCLTTWYSFQITCLPPCTICSPHHPVLHPIPESLCSALAVLCKLACLDAFSFLGSFYSLLSGQVKVPAMKKSNKFSRVPHFLLFPPHGFRQEWPSPGHGCS